MYRIGVLDQAKRQRDKQLARDRDAAALKRGEISHEELARRNGFFSAFDLSKASIVAIGARDIARYKADGK
jgi:hypothetical protein